MTSRGTKTALSRLVNRGAEISAEIKALEEERRQINFKICQHFSFSPNSHASRTARVKVQKSMRYKITNPEALKKELGVRFKDMVAVSERLTPKSGLKKLLSAPNPADTQLSKRAKKCTETIESLRVTYETL